MKKSIFLFFLTALLFPLAGVNFHTAHLVKGSVELPFTAEGDFFAEMVYTPSTGKKTHLVAAFVAKEKRIELRHCRNELQLLCNGKKKSAYPFYHGGSLNEIPRCDRYRVLLQKRGNKFMAVLEGELWGEVTCGSSPGKFCFKSEGKLAQLRISSGSIAPRDLRKRHLDFWRGITPCAPIPPSVAALPELELMPVIDGKVKEGGLKQCTRLSLRSMRPGTLNAPGKSSNAFYVGKKGKSLYFFWKLERKNPSPPLRFGKRDQGLWNVESAELFLLAPGGTKPYQFILSCAGELYDAAGSDRSWNGDVAYAARITKDLWCGEMLINTGDKGLPELTEKGLWKMDFFASQNWEAWAPAGRYHDTSVYGVLLFPKAPPRITSSSLTAVRDGEDLFREAFDAPGEVAPEIAQRKKFLKAKENMVLNSSFKGREGIVVRSVEGNGVLLYRHTEKIERQK